MLKRHFACAIALILMVGCGKNDSPQVKVAPGEGLKKYFVATPPANAEEIHIVRASAEPGAAITLKGLVMGRMKPFVEGRAAFVLGDRTILTPCNEKEGDECPTPWDVCCDSAELKRIGTATIQIVDEDGRVIAEELRGVNGLSELSKLTVRGMVAESSSGDALIVNASEIYVHHVDGD